MNAFLPLKFLPINFIEKLSKKVRKSIKKRLTNFLK